MRDNRLRLTAFPGPAGALLVLLVIVGSASLSSRALPLHALVPGLGMALGAGAPTPESAGLSWYSLQEGVSRVRKQYLPALVLYRSSGSLPLVEAPPAGDNGEREEKGGAGFFADIFAESSLKKIFKQFVLIRIERADLERRYPLPQKTPPPGNAGEKGAEKDGAQGGAGAPAGAPTAAPTVAEVLDLQGNRSSVVFLDFRERVVKRYDDDVDAGADAAEAPGGGKPKAPLPKLSQLKAEIDRLWKVNKVFATKAREVEPLLEKSLYSFRAGEVRAAVLLVVPMEEKAAQARMDPVLLDRLKKVIAEYRAKAEEAMRKADQLDKDKKHLEAIDAFDKVMKDFPFKDILQRAAKRKGEILRKVTFG